MTQASPRALNLLPERVAAAPREAAIVKAAPKRPLGYWAVSSIGAMAVGTFICARQGQGDMVAVPAPADVNYEDNLEIRDVVRAWPSLNWRLSGRLTWRCWSGRWRRRYRISRPTGKR